MTSELLSALGASLALLAGAVAAWVRSRGVDRSCDTDGVPDAPAPTYDSRGNQVAEWSVTIRYDAVRDYLQVYWNQEAGPYNKAKRLETTHDPHAVEDALADVMRAVRILGARRLF